MNLDKSDIEVCFGPECSDRGGRELAKELEAAGMPCFAGDCRSQCPNAPLVLVNNRMVVASTVARVQAKIQQLEEEGSS